MSTLRPGTIDDVPAASRVISAVEQDQAAFARPVREGRAHGGVHRERRDERGHARRQHTARLPAVEHPHNLLPAMSRTPEIEDATLDDLPSAVDLMNAVHDDSLVTVAGWRHAIESRPARGQQRLFKAVADGRIVGWASAGLDTHTTTAGVAFVGATVHPEHRGGGLGAALLDAAEEHVLGIGATFLHGHSRDEEPARRLATGRGYEQTFVRRISMLDPRTLSEEPAPPPGVELRSFAEIGDPEPIWRVDTTATLDMPDDTTWDYLPLDEWMREFWESPTIDRDASIAGLVDGTVVAITVIHVDSETGRAENDITGTLPEHRGHGLAGLVKLESLRRVAAKGVTQVFTENDETNAAMLAVNTRLGYRPHSARLSWKRTIQPAP
jgi:GNAT superfamily N-acetyltransferase